MRARDRGLRNRGQSITSFESAYGMRSRRHEADDAGQRHERGVGAAARVAHLACGLAFPAVMHRADLPWQQARAAAFVVVACRHAPAAERERRGDNTGDLAGEPEGDDPRKATTDRRHGSK